MFCSRRTNRKINHIHERALRLVYDDHESSFEELLIKDNSVCIHHRNIQYVAIEMYKVVHGMAPSIMIEIFGERREIPTRSGITYTKPKVNTVYMGENSLRVYGPIVWDNMLPEKFKSCTSLTHFKNSIKAWKPENCPCRLCKSFIPLLGFTSICV